MLAEFKVAGGALRLFDDRIVVRKTDTIGKKEKTLFFGQIAGIEFKKAGLSNGYLRIAVGGVQSKKGSFSAMLHDENTVVFGIQNNKKALQFKVTAEDAMGKFFNQQAGAPAATAATPADELIKLKTLLDGGAITQEEYDRKKAELLSRI